MHQCDPSIQLPLYSHSQYKLFLTVCGVLFYRLTEDAVQRYGSLCLYGDRMQPDYYQLWYCCSGSRHPVTTGTHINKPKELCKHTRHVHKIKDLPNTGRAKG